MEPLKHECGIVMIRLLKPLDYYQKKYSTWQYGLEKLYLMMEKQHNRGQEAAGAACVKLKAEPGSEYVFRKRALGTGAITEIFDSIYKDINAVPKAQKKNIDYIEKELPFAGEMYMGHLRYSTTGKAGLSYVHPFLRRNNWRAKTLLLCGNFNLTNVDDIYAGLTSIGQHPRNYSDTFLMLEQVGHRLDVEVEKLYRQCISEGMQGIDVTNEIDNRLDVSRILKKCSPVWDGGYAICGMTGTGESFCIRDPWGIRPAYYYTDDEIMVVASERPVIQTAMFLETDQVKELQRGEAILIDKKGKVSIKQIIPQKENKACSFERIYFSRGSDEDIYKERKSLGSNLTDAVLKKVNYDVKHSVFSFIPNTAEVAYYGLLEGLRSYLDKLKYSQIEKVLKDNSLSEEDKERNMKDVLSARIRYEKVAIKDIKLRTFIAEGKTRNDLAAHVYDITYGSINKNEDNLVVIDDSIVRGTTLKQSIIKILDRLQPKKIVVVSSSPQIRYPDCYGIDMSSMEEFIAFRAAMSLIRKRGLQKLLFDVYDKCLAQETQYAKEKAELERIRTERMDSVDKVAAAETKMPLVNFVKEIYAPFTYEEISDEIAQLLITEQTKAKVEIVYQTIEDLHKSCPNNPGDWYFSGDYPTKGGTRWVNKAYMNFIEHMKI